MIVNSVNVGRSLNFDEKQAFQVLKFALQVFDEAKDIHRLGNLERCYLIVASILHDVGTSVSNRSHHKHSFYVINTQEFFHFSNNEKLIVANIARYHIRSTPKVTHEEYMKLTHKDEMIVTKLASILRIADSLDNTGLQLVE